MWVCGQRQKETTQTILLLCAVVDTALRRRSSGRTWDPEREVHCPDAFVKRERLVKRYHAFREQCRDGRGEKKSEIVLT